MAARCSSLSVTAAQGQALPEPAMHSKRAPQRGQVAFPLSSML